MSVIGSRIRSVAMRSGGAARRKLGDAIVVVVMQLQCNCESNDVVKQIINKHLMIFRRASSPCAVAMKHRSFLRYGNMHVACSFACVCIPQYSMCL